MGQPGNAGREMCRSRLGRGCLKRDGGPDFRSRQHEDRGTDWRKGSQREPQGPDATERSKRPWCRSYAEWPKQDRAAGPIRRASCANRTWRRTGSFVWHWPWPSRNHTAGNKCESGSTCVADSFSVSWESLPPPPDAPVFSKIACIPRAVAVDYYCVCDAMPILSAVVARGLCPTAAGNSRGEGPMPSPLRAQLIVIRSTPAVAEEIQCPCESLQRAA